MRRQTRLLVACLFAMGLIAATGLTGPSQRSRAASQGPKLEGRWRIKFTLAGVEKNLVFDAKAKGIGSFMLLDTGPDNAPVANPLPAAWSQLTNDRVSFSGEAELPMGTCCREIGTIVFKGKFSSSNLISGGLIFVTSIEEEESPFKYHSNIGTFTASRFVD